MATLVEQFGNVRRVSTPLVAIGTTDANAVMAAITAAHSDAPVIQWDAARGFAVRTQPAGDRALAIITAKREPGTEDLPVLNPADAIVMAMDAPAGTILFVVNAHCVWDKLTVMQLLEMKLREQRERKQAAARDQDELTQGLQRLAERLEQLAAEQQQLADELKRLQRAPR